MEEQCIAFLWWFIPGIKNDSDSYSFFPRNVKFYCEEWVKSSSLNSHQSSFTSDVFGTHSVRAYAMGYGEIKDLWSSLLSSVLANVFTSNSILYFRL